MAIQYKLIIGRRANQESIDINPIYPREGNTMRGEPTLVTSKLNIPQDTDKIIIAIACNRADIQKIYII
ncbi:hypothetical protein [Microbulbifer halophilus]|uniref:hypothetical protein n=1 Tax=Microbulbifer halophilus TaxID=453963 RepID=UPI003622DB2C